MSANDKVAATFHPDHTRILAAQAHDYEGPVGEVPAYSDPPDMPLKLKVSPEYADLMRRANPRLVHALPQDDGTEPTVQGQTWREQAERLHEEVRRLRGENDAYTAALRESFRDLMEEARRRGARADAAEAKVARVEALHEPDRSGVCGECGTYAPCHTRRAVLDRTQGEEEGQ